MPARRAANITVRSALAVLPLALVQAGGCSRAVAPAYDEREALPAGDGTTSFVPFPSSELPVANLATQDKPGFFAGKALAHQPWIKAPTTTDARDGLGPLYNAQTCLDCHKKGGRGHIPAADRALMSSFLRLSIPGRDEKQGAVPEPTYGLQLQTQSTALSHLLRHQLRGYVDGEKVKPSVAPEATARVSWQSEDFAYPDGRRVALRKPKLEIVDLGYGPLHPQTLFSLRVAPPIHGMGLIELIEQSAIAELTDAQDANGDGISGRVSSVWDFRRNQNTAGRFGYKANRATLEITVAGAFSGDMGITSSLFPEQPCTAVQKDCSRQPHGADENGVEISDELLQLVVNFNRHLGVPKRRNPKSDAALAGRELFHALGCAGCHHPDFTTAHSDQHPSLSRQHIWPYSDFLLHDMGEGLSDGRPDYEASEREWRTTPLWGVGLSARISGAESYLHDGRAETLEQAVLWHGGEAQEVRNRFVALPQSKRQHLLSFLESL